MRKLYTLGSSGGEDRDSNRCCRLTRCCLAVLLGLFGSLFAIQGSHAQDDEDFQAYIERLRTADLTPRDCPDLKESPTDLSGIWSQTHTGARFRLTIRSNTGDGVPRNGCVGGTYTSPTGVIDELPAASEVALRVYGHRVREYNRGDCEDTELLFPFQRINRDRLKSAVAAVAAKGTIPLAYSLVQAAKDLVDARDQPVDQCAQPLKIAGRGEALAPADRVQSADFTRPKPTNDKIGGELCTEG